MKAIQLLIDEPLIAAVDQEAVRQKTDRSKLMREALRRYLGESKRRALETQHRRGYIGSVSSDAEIKGWESVQQWPED